jgi:DNA-binding transcriptional regulator YdaS (Cro superfamily)
VDKPKNLALERAIDVGGGITKLASALELSGHAVVHQWRLTRVPAEYCPRIERLTREAGEAVTCEELRPDIEWGVLREPAA